MSRRAATTWGRLALAALAFAAASSLACEQAAEEPEGTGRPVTKREPLVWTVPGGWSVDRTAGSGIYRGKYTIPTAGDAKHPATLLIWTVDTAKELESERADLVAAFEKREVAPEETKKVGDFAITHTDVSGRYKFPVGEPMGKTKKFPAHVLKDDWRALMATVDTQGRGRWVFRLVGPGDTVASARGAFRTMVDELK
ncbi:MAG: hypothetical protein RIF41_35765 [Polyangiaceae bacterium]